MDQLTKPASQHQPTTAPVGYQRTSGLAVASLVLGILWLGWTGSILAVIFGHVAHRDIKRSGGTVGGQGLATAGLVLGYIGVATLTLLVVGVAVASLSTTGA